MQAFVDPATKEVRGPAAEITRELAKRAGVPFTINGANGVQGVIDSVKNGEADIGFVAFDPMRAAQVDFSQDYALAQNTYLVPESSPIRSVADADRAGVRIGVGARDAGDYFLTRTLKHAELKRNEGGNLDAALKQLAAGEIDAYAGNRMRLHGAVQKTPGLSPRAGQFLRRRAVGDRAEGQCGAARDRGEVHRRGACLGADRGCDHARRPGRRRRRAAETKRTQKPRTWRVGTGFRTARNDAKMKAGPCRSTIPQFCFQRYAGATCAHRWTPGHSATGRRVGQVNII